MYATITDWQTETPATPENFAEAVGHFLKNLEKWVQLTCVLLK